MQKKISIGVEFFEKIIEEDYYYIDKTLFIKELIEKKGEVCLFTRPRRFGKTLALTTLQCFFDIQQKRRDLFDGLKIMENPEIVERYQNKYPVIFMTLKDVVSTSHEEAINKISLLIASVFRSHRYLYNSETLTEIDELQFNKYYARDVKESDLENSLQFLCECLYNHFEKKVIILIDEYDTPLKTALEWGYYPKMINFMRGFLGSIFKSNPYLEFGVLTGVQRVSQEGLFSSFNNPKINGVVSKEFSTCFGFTEIEVREACEYFNLDVKYEEVKKWYNGYRFGEQDIYNPWSITWFLDTNKFDNYWVNTGSMTFLRDIFQDGSDALKNKMADLLTDVPVEMRYTDRIVHPIVYENDNVFWSLLLNAGYIKPCVGSSEDEFYVELVNKEIRNTFADNVKSWFEKQPILHETIQEFVSCLLEGKPEEVKNILNEELLNNPSCHDFKAENSYHMFIFGILIATSKTYTIVSNQESGKGRADLMIKPFNKEKPAIVIEFKYLKRLSSGLSLTDLAQEGLKQIIEKKYSTTLKNEGYEKIYIYSFCFHKKECEMVYVMDNG